MTGYGAGGHVLRASSAFGEDYDYLRLTPEELGNGVDLAVHAPGGFDTVRGWASSWGDERQRVSIGGTADFTDAWIDVEDFVIPRPTGNVTPHPRTRMVWTETCDESCDSDPIGNRTADPFVDKRSACGRDDP